MTASSPTGTPERSQPTAPVGRPPGAPSPFSPAFHFSFLPRLLWARLWPVTGREPEHAHPEALLIPVASLAVTAVGASLGPQAGSVLGTLLVAAGVLGFAGAVVHSVRTRPRVAPSWDEFSSGVLVFCVTLGLATGLLFAVADLGPTWGAVAAVGGLLGGYVAGLAGGFWLQRLGWISGFIAFLAGIFAVGTLLVDMVLTVALFTRL